MLRVTSEIATYKGRSSKNLQFPKKTRSSHRMCSVKIGVLKSFASFTGKHLCWSLFLIKLQT